MSKREKMEEVKNVVDVEATEAVTETNNETTEEFMTIRLPKTAAYALLATGEATEVKDNVAVVDEKAKKKKFPKPTLKQVLIALGVTGAALGAAGAGYALGKRGENNPDDVSFDDVTPKGLPDYNGNYPTYERKTEDVDIEI